METSALEQPSRAGAGDHVARRGCDATVASKPGAVRVLLRRLANAWAAATQLQSQKLPCRLSVALAGAAVDDVVSSVSGGLVAIAEQQRGGEAGRSARREFGGSSRAAPAPAPCSATWTKQQKSGPPRLPAALLSRRHSTRASSKTAAQGLPFNETRCRHESFCKRAATLQPPRRSAQRYAVRTNHFGVPVAGVFDGAGVAVFVVAEDHAEAVFVAVGPLEIVDE